MLVTLRREASPACRSHHASPFWVDRPGGPDQFSAPEHYRSPGPVPAAAVWLLRLGGGGATGPAGPRRALLGRGPLGLPDAGRVGDRRASVVSAASRRHRGH